MADFNSVAQQFVEFYYKTFDANRADLAALYRPQSMLTFESSAIQGTQEIVAKLQGLPFQKIQHRVDTLDAQPGSTTGTGSIIILVTGALLVDEEQKPMSYSQVFQLQQEGGTYFVQNDLFKLIYAAA